MRNVQIPEDLFLDLVRYHLGGLDDAEIADRIAAGLSCKLDAMVKREWYGRYLSELDPDQKKSLYLQYAALKSET